MGRAGQEPGQGGDLRGTERTQGWFCPSGVCPSELSLHEGVRDGKRCRAAHVCSSCFHLCTQISTQTPPKPSPPARWALPVLCRLLQTCRHGAVGGWLLSSSRHIPLMEGLRYTDLVKFSASEKEMPCFTSAHRRSGSASIFLVRWCYQMASCVPPSTAALAV